MPLAVFVVPIIMWTTQKDVNANVDLHGKNILNAIISYAIYALILTITVIGIRSNCSGSFICCFRNHRNSESKQR